MNLIRFYYYKVTMPPRRMTRTTQGIARETSQPRDGGTPHLTSGTPQEEGVVDPNGSTSRARQEPNMAQLMQTLIRMVQTQQQIQQQMFEQQQIQRDTQQHQYPPPQLGEQPVQRNNISEFKKLAPPAFKGTTEPLEADNWIMEMEKAFAVQECLDEEKIRYAVYLLQEEAYNWSQRLQRKHEQDGEILTWERFWVAFYDQYFPRSIRIQKEQEFIYLKQKGMSVTEYEAKFTELAKFAPRLVDGEQERVHKFEMGLRTEIRK